jgi:hypothetical protein
MKTTFLVISPVLVFAAFTFYGSCADAARGVQLGRGGLYKALWGGPIRWTATLLAAAAAVCLIR